uniref:Selenoprotein O n=1 Tax=Dermatophagoides pteronyssinus TaxID=6956 RepID=A0A6P6YK66_DERPT|nr:selenoprotein O-like [Dermatophagoides pteronyssinus]
MLSRFKLWQSLIIINNTRQTMFSIAKKSLNDLIFDNQTLKCLPIDHVEENYVRTVKNACYSLVNPTPLDNPRLVCYSSDALRLLDLNSDSIDDDDYFINCFAGNTLIPGSQPAAHCYCGHQFGVFAGQLGDGAAIYLGEVINSRQERWELQLKGAGPTPFSRDADGRKVLRSSLREFLCSEAMHNLGIPTTRAATCIVSDTKIVRDQFYDGHQKLEPCAVISRIAPAFLRFGSFEIFRKLDPSSGCCGPSVGNRELLQTMIDFTIKSYFPNIFSSSESPVEKYKSFFCDVVKRTAKLVARWQAFGFVHGVLNTDNMSILGLTIDYGPFGFLDRFDPDHISNTSDPDGRYSFKKQPEICLWNLLKFAEVLDSLVPFAELKTIVKDSYYKTFSNEYIDLMRKKLGLFKKITENLNDEEILSDKKLIEKYLETLDLVGGDYTNCFRNLNILIIPGLDGHENSMEQLQNKLMEQSSSFEEAKTFYKRFLHSPMVYMNVILLQNFQNHSDNENVISMLQKLERYKHLNEIDEHEYLEQCRKNWNEWISAYIKRIEFETKEFSDKDDLIKYDNERRALMNSVNPRYVLRNHLAQKAIEKAEQENFDEARRLLHALEKPFNENPDFDDYTERPTSSMCTLRVSCSS